MTAPNMLRSVLLQADEPNDRNVAASARILSAGGPRPSTGGNGAKQASAVVVAELVLVTHCTHCTAASSHP